MLGSKGLLCKILLSYCTKILYTNQIALTKVRQVRSYSSLRRHSMSVGPWAVSFGALVPLHESHSESGRLMNYSCVPAVPHQ